MGLKWASVVGFVILVLALIALYVRGELFDPRPLPIALQVLAGLLMVWARLTFGTRSFHASANPTDGGLVTSGPYAYVRHPIYAAVLLFLGVGVATHLSVASLCIFGIAIAGAATRMFAEEVMVTERYPEYAQYAARTKRVIPFVV
jgi:protein-S-isoprenylcysteine O-methyltransferase Ste14